MANHSDRNPAWDFLLYTDDAASHPEGEWKGRLVYKRFLSRDDILIEYRDFQQFCGREWVIPPYGK